MNNKLTGHSSNNDSRSCKWFRSKWI